MKAIVVFNEMPKTCEECKYCIKMGNNGHWFGEYCTLQSCGIYCDENGLDKNCPLKPMPQKKDFFEEYMKVDRSMCKQKFDKVQEELRHQILGYNYCIDEILGDNDE